MATRQEQLRELRRLLITKESELDQAELRLSELCNNGWAAGEYTKQDKKILRLKAELKTLQQGISKRETTMQKRKAASG